MLLIMMKRMREECSNNSNSSNRDNREIDLRILRTVERALLRRLKGAKKLHKLEDNPKF